ncbi:H-NS histone family protein [Salmonella enterica]|nr:H-NS histone family protein [Salmonella enterica]
MNKKTSLTVNAVADYLSSVTRRTAVFKKMDLRLLGIVRADLIRIIEIREEQLEEERLKQKQKQEKIREHLTLLQQDGIEPDELLNNVRPKKRPSIGQMRTFRVKGKTVHYKGVGVYPRVLREIIDSEGGDALQSYEITDE